MNEVNWPLKAPTSPKPSDLYRHKATGEIYMVTDTTAPVYALTSLASGLLWG